MFAKYRSALTKAVSTLLCLGLVSFTVYSVAAAPAWFGPKGETTALSAADDPVRNGLRIVETPNARRVQVQNSQESAIVLLDEWTFTGKTKPSPYK